MTQMSMNKAIHGAIRRDIDRFIDALREFTPGNTARVQQLNLAWLNFDRQLTDHHEGEERIAFPALKAIGASSELLAELDSEHAAMAEALDEVRESMWAFVRTASGDDAASVRVAFEALKAATVSHLDHEEAETEELLHSHADDPAIKAMGRAFGKVSPAKGGQFFAWVLDGASADEERTVRAEVPGPVLTIIGGVFGRNYRKTVAPTWRG